MTSYDFGDVVLVPFPFTDHSGMKKRPAVVISSAAYNISRPDLILMAITSRVRKTAGFGEVAIAEWRKAGLLKVSVIKPVLTTVERRLVLRQLGRLEHSDRTALQQVIRTVIG
jgi:mRNA interferase MazF